jgi:Rrf2 family transcriptional regulator, iron-sulfur cluster assembly transcription factor
MNMRKMNMLSDTAEYAVRATLYIAQNDREQLVQVDRVASTLGVPRNYLSKILHTLAKQGVLNSTRGPHGGFRLAMDPDTLSLARVIEPFDPRPPGRTCLLGRSECSDLNPCPAHERWKGIGDRVSTFFRNTSVGDLLREEGSLTDPVGEAH